MSKRIKGKRSLVGIIDLNSGNLLSIKTAIEKADCDWQVVGKADSELLNTVDVLVMPGQGRFAYVMNQIDALGWRDFLFEWCRNGKRLVGICVGMQVLFEGSEEDPATLGLGLFKGQCQKLSHPKTPMVGWARLRSQKPSLKDGFAYFVNSFAVYDSPFCTAKVSYGHEFCAAVQRGNLYGFQFHPEKSGNFGKELIKYVCQ